MWAVLAAGIAFIGTIVFSLAKAGSQGERISEKHREELLARKKEKKD